MCRCVSVRGREARLSSLIFWEQQGGVVDPPAPFSLQLDLVGFQQLHPLTKHLFVIFPRRTNTTATSRGERKEEGRWTVEIERKRAVTVQHDVDQCHWCITQVMLLTVAGPQINRVCITAKRSRKFTPGRMHVHAKVNKCKLLKKVI